jgi:hypothetical protein
VLKPEDVDKFRDAPAASFRTPMNFSGWFEISGRTLPVAHAPSGSSPGGIGGVAERIGSNGKEVLKKTPALKKF